MSARRDPERDRDGPFQIPMRGNEPRLLEDGALAWRFQIPMRGNERGAGGGERGLAEVVPNPHEG